MSWVSVSFTWEMGMVQTWLQSGKKSFGSKEGHETTQPRFCIQPWGLKFNDLLLIAQDELLLRCYLTIYTTLDKLPVASSC